MRHEVQDEGHGSLSTRRRSRQPQLVPRRYHWPR
jgi:hypothetical protein